MTLEKQNEEKENAIIKRINELSKEISQTFENTKSEINNICYWYIRETEFNLALQPLFEYVEKNETAKAKLPLWNYFIEYTKKFPFSFSKSDCYIMFISTQICSKCNGMGYFKGDYREFDGIRYFKVDECDKCAEQLEESDTS